jgi:uncharacterized protein YjiK
MFRAKAFAALSLLAMSSVQSDATNAPPRAVAASAAAGLDRYVLKAGPIVIPGATNCSGIAFNPQTRTLLVVANAPTEVYELSLDGTRRRTIALNGFDDTEDIAFVDRHTIAVVEERRRNLCLIDILSNATAAAYADAVRVLVDPVDSGNSGLEGVTYDATRERFFVVKEKKPRRIYMVGRPRSDPQQAAVSNPWDIESNNLKCNDLSAVFYHAGSGHLLIVSDESRCIVEATLGGEEIARLPLKAGTGGLRADVPQPEGIAIDDQGDLYICSEPNLLYIFCKPRNGASE